MKQNSLKMTPKIILQRGNYFYFLYYWIYALVSDYCLAKKSLSKTVFYNAKGAYPVQSISYIYLRELLLNVYFDSDEVFVDVGCAWGRLLGYMCKHTNIKRFIGVELNEEVANHAMQTFHRNSRVTIISGNILNNLPPEGTIFYLFNPFDADILSLFLNKIEEKIKHPIKLLYLYPTCKMIIDSRFPRWILDEEIILKPKHLGALKLLIYSYVP